jgi:LmbE family N-acetylglucosaminyl deacetylase
MRTLTAARQRRLERAMHLLTGAILLTYVYLPGGGELEAIIRYVVFALLALSGMAMWQAPRLRRALKAARRRRRPDLHLAHLPVLAERAPAVAETRPRLERRR